MTYFTFQRLITTLPIEIRAMIYVSNLNSAQYNILLIKKIGRDVTPLRAVELIMYENGAQVVV
jgi:hypothetical protein